MFIWVETTTSMGDFPLEPTPYGTPMRHGSKANASPDTSFWPSWSHSAEYEVMWWWLMEWNTVYPLVPNMHVWLYVHVMWIHANTIQGRRSVFLEFLQWIQTICIHSWNILKCTNIPKHSIYRRDATMLDVKNWDPWILLFLPWGSLQRQASKRYSPPFWPWIWPWVFQKRPTSCCQLLMS